MKLAAPASAVILEIADIVVAICVLFLITSPTANACWIIPFSSDLAGSSASIVPSAVSSVKSKLAAPETFVKLNLSAGLIKLLISVWSKKP